MIREIHIGDTFKCQSCEVEFVVQEFCCNEDDGEYFLCCPTHSCGMIPVLSTVRCYIDVEEEDE